MEPDATDVRVLNAALEAGTTSEEEIAERTALAVETVTDRLEKLEDAGFIDGFVPGVDYEAAGYDLTAIIHLSVATDALTRTVDRLASRDCLVTVYEVTGPEDVVAIGKFTDAETLDAQLMDLLTDPAVDRISTDIVSATVAEFDQFTVDTDERDH